MCNPDGFREVLRTAPGKRASVIPGGAVRYGPLIAGVIKLKG